MRSVNLHSITENYTHGPLGQKALIIWLTGLSGSGKTSIAIQTEERLREKGIKTFRLDGDDLRNGLCQGLGFSQEDRTENLRRAAHVAKLLASAGLVVLASFISPLESQRKMIAEILGPELYFEVFVDCPIETCEARDVKGHYHKARIGQLAQFTGLASDYEKPLQPNLVLNTNKETVSESAGKLLAALKPWFN